MNTPIILASASPVRAAMLRQAGVDFAIDPANNDEEAVKQALLEEGAPPRDIADALADLKARRTALRNPGRLVLGSDQILVCDGRLFNKAADLQEAADALRALRGKTHTIHSAAVVYKDGEPLWRHVGQARMTMRAFTESFLGAYIEDVGDAILGSVGCYHLEGRGAQLFSRIEGDYFTVLGLPLLPLLDFLRSNGVLRE